MAGSGPNPFDLLVIGGGVNGAGIARDAAGRGLSVLLCEKDDLGSATSSASSKLIHGGLRYLEHYEFRLVREALIEREVLLRAAPHIIWPLRFVLPHDRSMRPAWMLRLGLFLYDHLGGRRLLPPSRGIDLRRHPAGRPLKPVYTRGFEYSDCWVEDSRLVLLNATDAGLRGAEVLTRTRCAEARREGAAWRARLQAEGTGEVREVAARAVVNAAGPWVGDVLSAGLGLAARYGVRLVKGSHIVVPRLYEGDHAYILQNEDRRIVFAIPYEHRFTLIGTTDVDYRGDPAKVAISEDETAYLCRLVDRYFERQLTPADVAWSYSGVRPLYDDRTEDASAVTRDYVLELDTADGAAPPLLSVFGGKITTYRRLAEQAVDMVQKALGRDGRPWTGGTPLPGGDIPNADFEGFLAGLQRRHPWLPPAMARRLARAYGTRAPLLLGEAADLADLGEHMGGDLYAAELEYGIRHEFVRTAEDFLWRRSKLGLHLDAAAREAVAAWFARRADGTRRLRTAGGSR
ncbi:glycerol-3-phosphate dehydrogenase [Arenibaculum pallidiluteum]|uniref:glycerol-3-phosphate dehydrogenase n=1 Tax=Arenibaculum pallidiluteum TaxID=2812559 RepID=UPI001A96EE07|nr:glycerol-3-phosphate dehydrogenase [Arenibaculum pallidiluteum]